MTGVHPAADTEPAQWLLRSEVGWADLVRYGPPGFDVYVRIAFTPYPHDPDQEGEEPGLRRALTTLARFTTTPAAAYAAIWEGWTSATPAPPAPVVRIPNRTMLLFTGPVEVLRDAPALAWHCTGRTYQEPHLVWPGDLAWCLACDVDEEVEFTVGCSDAAAQGLTRAMPGAVRRVRYGEPSRGG
jgi:hypothetical protein